MRPRSSTPLIATLMLLGSLTGCVRERVIMVPTEGPYILQHPVTARIAYEDPPGSGKFTVSENPVTIPAGLTIFKYDWTRKP